MGKISFHKVTAAPVAPYAADAVYFLKTATGVRLLLTDSAGGAIYGLETPTSTTDSLESADLKAIAALAGTTGLLRKTAAGTWSLDTSVYLTGITSGMVTTALGYVPVNPNTRGAANGIATLDAGGKVPAAQLPGFVDDVVDVANFASLPATGEASKIYLLGTPHTLNGVTSSQFRWSGTAYAPIVSSPGSTDAVAEGATNLYFTPARALAAIGGKTFGSFVPGGIVYAASATLAASTPAGTAGQFAMSNGAAAPTWKTLEMSDIPDAAFKKSVKAATVADLGAGAWSTANTGTLTGYAPSLSLALTTTVGSTTVTTTSTAGVKVGAVSSGNANIPAGATVVSIPSATTLVLSAAATVAATAVATTLTQTISALVIDGVAVAANDRVLVKNQTATAQNGIYIVTNAGSASVAWVLTRAADANTSSKISAALVAIDAGTVNGADLWTNNFRAADALNTAAMNWYEVLYNSGTWNISVTGNAATVGGLAVHAARNNEANKVVRTDANGYVQLGWINTTSGDNGLTALGRIYASGDDYIRYYTPVNFSTVLGRALYIRETNGGTLTAGRRYSIYTGDGAKTMAMPTFANAAMGDEIEIVNLQQTWETNAFTITCPASVKINMLTESLVCDYNVGGFTLVCVHKDATAAYWTVRA